MQTPKPHSLDYDSITLSTKPSGSEAEKWKKTTALTSYDMSIILNICRVNMMRCEEAMMVSHSRLSVRGFDYRSG